MKIIYLNWTREGGWAVNDGVAQRRTSWCARWTTEADVFAIVYIGTRVWGQILFLVAVALRSHSILTIQHI